MERQFKDAELRARRHWFADGVAELVIGGAFVVVAFYLWLETALSNAGTAGRLSNAIVGLLLPALVLVAAIVGRRLIRHAKEHLVYPRAGYVAFAEKRERRWLPGLIAGVLAGLTVALVHRAPDLETWLPALQGFLFGGAMVGIARKSGLARLLVPGLLVMIAGIAVSLLRPSSDVAAALVFGAAGLVLSASGWLALRRFLRVFPREGE